MAVAFAIPSGMWIQITGTEWEVYQDSGEVAFLGDDDVLVRIRRAASKPTVWGPRPPVVGVSAEGDGSRPCQGLPCKCMNLDDSGSGPHYSDYDCRYA